MRAGWVGNHALQKRVLAADPDYQRIIEAHVVESEDVINTKPEWQAMDAAGLADFEFLDDGGIRLLGASSTYVDHGGDAGTDATDDELEDPQLLDNIFVAEIHWSGNNVRDTEIFSVVARLDARRDGGNPQQVAFWKCRLYRVAELSLAADLKVSLEPISQIATVAPGGATVENVTFNLTGTDGQPVRVGRPPGSGILKSITVLRIWGVKADGSPAGNSTWWGDPDSQPIDGDGDIPADLYGWEYSFVDDGAESQTGATTFRRADTAPVGRFQLRGRTYTEETATFTDTPLDLGAAPTDPVRFVARGEQPGDSALTFEVRNDADSAWVPFVDGDLAASLAGVTDRQTYDVRVTLTPSTDGNSTPVARDLGVRAVSITDLGPAKFEQEPAYSVDPITHKSEIPEAVIRLRRGGEVDYRDAVTRLFSEHHLSDIELVEYLTAPDLPRADWLHLDTYQVEDYQTDGPDVVVYAMHPLHLLGTTIPPFDPVADERTPYEGFANTTLKATYEDLLDTLIELPPRFIGAGPLDDTTTVSKVIRESRGKDELDAIAFLNDSAAIASQGRVKAVSMAKTGGPVASLIAEELRVVTITPGFRQRITEFFVPWGWDESVGEFEAEVRSFHGLAILNLGTSPTESLQKLDAEVGKWITSEAHASLVAKRMRERFGTGLILWTVRCNYLNPHLEPGDLVTVETDRFVAANPNEDPPTPIRGWVTATGVVQEVKELGREVTVWIQSYADIVASTERIDRTGFIPATHFSISLQFVADPSGSGIATLVLGAAIRSFRIWAKVGVQPTEAEIEEFGRLVVVTGPVMTVTGIGAGNIGDVLYCGVIGYRNVDGTGDQTAVTYGAAPIQDRPINAAPQFRLLPVITGTTGIVQAILVADPHGTMNPFGAGDTEARVEFRRVDTGVQIDHTPTNPTTGPTYQPASAYTGLSATPLRIEVTAWYWRTEDELASVFLGAVDLVENPLAEIDDGYADWHFTGFVRLKWKYDNQTTIIRYIARRSGPYPSDAATRADIIANGTDLDVATYGVPSESTLYFTTPDASPDPGETYYWAALAYDGATEGVVTVGSRVRDPGLRGLPFAFSANTNAEGRWIDAQWDINGEIIAGTNVTQYAGYPFIGVGGTAGAGVQAIRLKVSLTDMPDDDWVTDPGVLLKPLAVGGAGGTQYEADSFVATFPDLLGVGSDGSAQVVVGGIKMSTFAPFHLFGAGVQFTNVLLANPNQRLYVRAQPLGDPNGILDPGPSITTIIYGFDTALSLPISFPDDQPERVTFASPENAGAHSLADMGLVPGQFVRGVLQARVLDGSSGTANLRFRFFDIDFTELLLVDGPSVSGFDAGDGRIVLEVPAQEIPADTDILAAYIITSHGAEAVAFGNLMFFTRLVPTPSAAAALAPAAATHEQAALSAAPAAALPAVDAARHGSAADELGGAVMAVPIRDRTNTVSLIDEEGRATDDMGFGTGSQARTDVSIANRDISATQAAIGYGGVPVPPVGGQYIPGYTGQGTGAKTDNNFPDGRRAQWQKFLFAEELTFSEFAIETGPNTNDPGVPGLRFMIATVAANGLLPDDIVYESPSIPWETSAVIEVTGLSYEREPGAPYLIGACVREGSDDIDATNFPTTKRWDDPADSVRLFPIATAGGDFSDSACLITETEPTVSYASGGALPQPWTGAALVYTGESACFWMLRS